MNVGVVIASNRLPVRLTISGQDKGHVKTWFDRAGDPIMQVGHIKANEIDTNDSTARRS